MTSRSLAEKAHRLIYSEDAFQRQDEGEDEAFYATPRPVAHLDSVALETVERIIGTLVVEPRPVMLDLMASWDSHLPPELSPGRLVGLGLNQEELRQNAALSDFVRHDLNRDPRLPFHDDTFDVVLNTVSVDYLTRPFEVFRDVGRVLKPGGLYLVIFSNRMFPEKVVKIWRESNEVERLLLVEDFFQRAGLFERPRTVVSKGRSRPPDDKYAAVGIPSDPVYAVYADRLGSPRRVPRPPVVLDREVALLEGEALKRQQSISRRTLACPHCGEPFHRYRVPETPFVEWDCEFLYLCFNDQCPFLLRGWSAMHRQGNRGMSHRVMLHPEHGTFHAVPVPSLHSLRDGLMDDGVAATPV